MPLYGQRSYTLTIPGGPKRSAFGQNQLLGNEEMITGQLGEVGTQFDGPGHIGTRLRMADGTERDVYYNGFTWEQIQGDSGLRELGVEQIKPILTRGLLIDIAGYKNVPILPPTYQVTLADLRGALARQGINDAWIQPGDAAASRHSPHWAEAAWRARKACSMSCGPSFR